MELLLSAYECKFWGLWNVPNTHEKDVRQFLSLVTTLLLPPFFRGRPTIRRCPVVSHGWGRPSTPNPHRLQVVNVGIRLALWNKKLVGLQIDYLKGRTYFHERLFERPAVTSSVMLFAHIFVPAPTRTYLDRHQIRSNFIPVWKATKWGSHTKSTRISLRDENTIPSHSLHHLECVFAECPENTFERVSLGKKIKWTYPWLNA